MNTDRPAGSIINSSHIPLQEYHVCSDHPAIRVSHLGKKYTIGGPQEKYHTFRDAIVSSVKAPFKRLSSREPLPEFRALKDVSFDVSRARLSASSGGTAQGSRRCFKDSVADHFACGRDAQKSRLIVFDNTTLNKQLEISFRGERTLDEIGEFLTG